MTRDSVVPVPSMSSKAIRWPSGDQSGSKGSEVADPVVSPVNPVPSGLITAISWKPVVPSNARTRSSCRPARTTGRARGPRGARGGQLRLAGAVRVHDPDLAVGRRSARTRSASRRARRPGRSRGGRRPGRELGLAGSVVVHDPDLPVAAAGSERRRSSRRRPSRRGRSRRRDRGQLDRVLRRSGRPRRCPSSIPGPRDSRRRSSRSSPGTPRTRSPAITSAAATARRSPPPPQTVWSSLPCSLFVAPTP